MEAMTINHKLFETNNFCHNGTPSAMFSGEFHYFRVPKAEWRRRLRLWKAAGGTAVATYVPWMLHEPQEGVFRLELLREFLDVVADEQVDLIVRPGPYQYSELVNDGLPQWLLDKYPQILARDKQGRPFRSSSVSYQHPVFLEKVENYFAKVCPILAEYTLSKGGPIVCTQADNELFGIHCWFGSLDYNAETFGFGREFSPYAAYLWERFGDVELLNRRYGTNHRTLHEFTLADEPKEGVPAFLWNRDYFDFYVSEGIDYLATLVAMMRKYGIDGQFCHNSANPSLTPWLRDLRVRLKEDFLLGSDHYYCLNQSWPQNNPTPQYFVNCFLDCELLRVDDNPPSVLEFPFGSCSDFPAITATDLTAALYMHLAVGTKGFNGYVLTGGPNPPGAGTNTDLYDYNAPISASGELRPTYAALKRFGKFLARHQDLQLAEPAVDFQFMVSLQNGCANAPGLPKLELPGTMEPHDLWEGTLRRGVLTTAFAEGLLPQMADRLAAANPEVPLVLFCDGTMSASFQRAVLRRIREGWRILCLPILPRYDEDLNPCTILADGLGLAMEGLIDQERERPRITVGPVANVCCNHGWARATAWPESAEVLGREENSGAPVCVKCSVGKGIFIWLGMNWFYTNREQRQLLAWLLEQLGMKRHLVKDDEMVFCTLRGRYLFACNLTTSPRKVRVTVADAPNGAFDLRLPPMKVQVLEWQP